jgi:hypothetical protein
VSALDILPINEKLEAKAVGELTSSLPSEAFAPIARTCGTYCTSIAVKLSLVSSRVDVGSY